MRRAGRMEGARIFEEALRRQEAAGLMRVERPASKPDARRIVLEDGRALVDFSSNSYLGLQDLARRRIPRRFLKEGHLTSASSSRMVSGARDVHLALERTLAGFLGAEDAVVFGSGFLACAGVIETLAGGRDTVFFDERVHASLRTGMEWSKALCVAYAHADIADLKMKLLKSHRPGQVFIVTDGLFSMEGDYAPLAALVKLASAHHAWLIVDDAHGIGAVGRRGRGTFERAGVRPTGRCIVLGTLSKTLGSFGGFAAAPSSVIRYIKARSRAFIYTTAAPPFQVIAAQEALSVIRSGVGARLRAKLARNMRILGRHLSRRIESPIVSIPVPGGPEAVLAAARRLQDAGCHAIGMRYPTVPRGSEMIRVSLSAVHTATDIRRLASAIQDFGLRA